MTNGELVQCLEARLKAGGELFLNLAEWQQLEQLAKTRIHGAFYGQQLMVRAVDLAGAIEQAKYFIAQHTTERLTK
jgi:hypothetical protein